MGNRTLYNNKILQECNTEVLFKNRSINLTFKSFSSSTVSKSCSHTFLVYIIMSNIFSKTLLFLFCMFGMTGEDAEFSITLIIYLYG